MPPTLDAAWRRAWRAIAAHMSEDALNRLARYCVRRGFVPASMRQDGILAGEAGHALVVAVDCYPYTLARLVPEEVEIEVTRRQLTKSGIPVEW